MTTHHSTKENNSNNFKLKDVRSLSDIKEYLCSHSCCINIRNNRKKWKGDNKIGVVCVKKFNEEFKFLISESKFPVDLCSNGCYVKTAQYIIKFCFNLIIPNRINVENYLYYNGSPYVIIEVDCIEFLESQNCCLNMFKKLNSEKKDNTLDVSVYTIALKALKNLKLYT